MLETQNGTHKIFKGIRFHVDSVQYNEFPIIAFY